MNIGCIIQARTGSSRFPDKVLQDIIGKPLLLRVLDRVIGSKKISKFIVATSNMAKDDRIAELIDIYNSNENKNIYCFRGNELDVLDRYYQAAKNFSLDAIVRTTGDNPLQD